MQQLLGTAIDIILDFKDRELYDNFSMGLIKLDSFTYLIKAIVNMKITREDFKTVARIFELCACHPDGIKVLSKHLTAIVHQCNRFM